MALVKCHECGGKLSTEAAACPSCGAPRREAAPAVEEAAPRSALLAEVRRRERERSAAAHAASEQRYERWLLVVALVVGVTFLIVRHVTQPAPVRRDPVERFGELSSEYVRPHSQALALARIPGCGDMRWQAVLNRPGEHRVFCSRDGSNWTRYRVHASGRVEPDFSPVDSTVMDALLRR